MSVKLPKIENAPAKDEASKAAPFAHHHPNPHPAPHAKFAQKQTRPGEKKAHHAS